MEKILLNLANVLLIEFCKREEIDCSGTKVYKYPRRWTYALVKEVDGRAVATVSFYKNAVPCYTKGKN